MPARGLDTTFGGGQRGLGLAAGKYVESNRGAQRVGGAFADAGFDQMLIGYDQDSRQAEPPGHRGQLR